MSNNSTIPAGVPPASLPLLLLHTDLSVALTVVLSRQPLFETGASPVHKQEPPSEPATKRVTFSDTHQYTNFPSSQTSIIDEDDTIEKPTGENGRPGRGGYALEIALNWSAPKFKSLKVSGCFLSFQTDTEFEQTCVHSLCEDYLDVAKALTYQDEESIDAVCEAVSDPQF